MKVDFKKKISSFLKFISDKSSKRFTFSSQEVLDTEKPHTYKLPINYNNLPVNVKDILKHTIVIPKRHILTTNNIFSTGNGIVFKNLKIFIPSLAEPWVKQGLSHTFLLKQWYGNHIALSENEESIALVYDQWSNGNYYHWIIDSLPRLLLLRQKFPNQLLLLPSNAPEFIKTTATILGFNRFFYIEPDQILEAHKFLIPEITAPSSHHDPTLICQVRQELVTGIGQYPGLPKRRLYISRAKQKVRRLVNEVETIELLQKYGFEIIQFEDYSFEEQVRLSQEAEIIIGIHGANLTNILFMQPKGVVIELMNELNVYLLYYHLCSYLQLNYYLLICKQADFNANLAQDNIFYHNNSDLYLELSELETILNSILLKDSLGLLAAE